MSAKPAEEQACDLCGLDCGKDPLSTKLNDEPHAFCCPGCLNVYAILIESGVIAAGEDVRETELFKRSLSLGLISNANQNGRRRWTIPANTPTQEVLLQVSGLWCPSCAWLIEHALSAERGVVSAEAFFTSDLVKVKYCPQFLPAERISERINALGYNAFEFTGEDEHANSERRDLLLRLGIAGFLWLNIMTLSMTLYVGYFEKISDTIARRLPLVLLVLTTPVIFYSAQPILRLAYQGLINRTVRMETLLGLGILTAYFYSGVQAIRGETHVYFDTASAIVTLVLVGKLIERSAKQRTAKAITLLYRLMPKKVRLFVNGEERFVSVAALNSGDMFVVKAGERIPADGIVTMGNSHADESLLTGESIPISKEVGSQIISGSINISGVIHARATKVGNDTTLAQIIRMVENALSSRSTLERTVDRASRIFVPSVVAIAVATFLVCWIGGFATTGDSLVRAITVLVIACPCALGMATPLAITAAVGAASQKGILVGDSRVLEIIRQVNTVILDKTGTVTEGDFALLDWEVRNDLAHATGIASGPIDAAQAAFRQRAQTFATVVGGRFFADVCLPLIASLERYSEHPLGRATVAYAEAEDVMWRRTNEVKIHKGMGITGRCGEEEVFVGNRRLMEAEADGIDPQFEIRARQWEKEGHTVAFFGWAGTMQGLLAFGDRIKTEAVEVVDGLRSAGIKVVLVSGDASTTTEWVAKAIGADDFIAEALPDRKTEVVASYQAGGSVVAMIGDGINDAPALAQADLGIAMGSGTDVAMRAAAVVLMSNSLDKILETFDLSYRTSRVVRQNLFWAFFYNSFGISLAVLGVLNPIIAAGAMLLSSLSVIGNSMRLSAGIRNTQCASDVTGYEVEVATRP